MAWTQQLTARLDQSPLWQRWQRLAPRERRALLLLGLCLILAAGYLGLWQPAQRGLAEARDAYRQQRTLHAYLEQNAELARQLGPVAVPGPAPEQLQGLVTETAQAQGLQIESLDSQGDGALTVSLPQASGSALLDWLAVLQAQGVQLEQASLERLDAGLVNARLTLRTGE